MTKNADHLQSGASTEGSDLHAYHTDWREQRNRSVYSFTLSEGNDRCRLACSSMKFSANNNSADQSAHMQNPEPATEVEISQLNGKVLCKQ